MLPLCADEGVGVLPWSPLARGRLTRDWDDSTERSRTDEFGKRLYQEGDRAVVEAVAAVAAERGVPRARVALAWLLQRNTVAAPVVGVTKQHHIEDAVAAVTLELSDKEREILEEPYRPHPISGH